jgi:hypothetical protein
LNGEDQHGLPGFLVVASAIVAAQVAGQVVLSFTGRSVPIVLAVMGLVLCTGLSVAALTLGATSRCENRSR